MKNAHGAPRRRCTGLGAHCSADARPQVFRDVVGRRAALYVLLPAAALLAAGCQLAGPLSTLDPAGPGAAPITRVWWIMFWGSMALLVFMTGLGLYVTFRRSDRPAPVSANALLVGGGLALPIVVLTALLAWGVRAGHSLLPLPTGEPVFLVDVTAHQWWWEVGYPGQAALPAQPASPPVLMPAMPAGGDAAAGAPVGAELREPPAARPASRIDIPAGRPVDLRIRSADVIHSFWVPRLGGKIDAVPGRTNTIRLRADAPGVYRGVCAEFCGAGHAQMPFEVHAHDEAGLARALEGRP